MALLEESIEKEEVIWSERGIKVRKKRDRDQAFETLKKHE